MSLLTKLDKLMREKRINKAQLSRDTGIPYTTISSLYHKGYENIRLSTLQKLADYFECSLDYIVDMQDRQGQKSILSLSENGTKSNGVKSLCEDDAQ